MTRLAALAFLGALVATATVLPQDDPPKTDVRAFSVTATPPPIPALKYELLPKLRDRVPGNAALEYPRAYALRPAWPADPEEARRLSAAMDTYERTPIDELPVAEVRRFLGPYAASFRALDQAALCDRCIWEKRPFRPDEIASILPEVQSVRELARLQVFRIRADLAANDFDAAVRDLQTGFRMGKDVGEGRTMIQLLVGIAITSIFVGQTEQFIQRPDAPNLYWALTALPTPFIDPRPALEGEAALFDGMFPGAKELQSGPVPAEKANRILEDMAAAVMKFTGNEKAVPDALLKLGLTAQIAAQLPESKKQLLALGVKADDIEKMPPAQVVALRTVLTYRSLYDDQAKAFYLPYPQARAELQKVRDRANKLRAGTTDVSLALFALAVPATEKVYEAVARSNRRLAGLRAVEAVRLHAAQNGGTPPKSLADVTVPVPDDPQTGKPFEYKADGAKFTLTAPASPGDEPHVGNNFRYEVTIRPAK